MKFYSTNNKNLRVTFKEALMNGMPLDDGLYMPEDIPDHSSILKGINTLNIQDISFIISQSILCNDLSNSLYAEVLAFSIYLSVTSSKNTFVITAIRRQRTDP